eukprot:CCRYP_014293-RA/>CCRYP_014293-RA protein AED:0.20 eAED:0.20 QI:2111/1/1/1/0.5/0.4/5/1142/432
MDSNEIIGLIAAFLAALAFGSYGVPMKGEAATRVNVDPLVFQTYKASVVLLTSSLLIVVNNLMANFESTENKDPSVKTFNPWSIYDFTPWAFVSASMWVPGGTAGVYAIRRAGLAISVGLWSCVIVILSFVWGVLVFHEKQRSGVRGAMKALAVLCTGLCGIAYFSSFEAESKSERQQWDKVTKHAEKENIEVRESTPLMELADAEKENSMSLDFETYPHCGVPPHSHQTIHIDPPAFLCPDGRPKKHTIHIPEYNIGICMAVLNGVFAASIMVPLHYAPPSATQGVGYSMSFGIAAVVVVLAVWIIRWLFHSSLYLRSDRDDHMGNKGSTDIIVALSKGYKSLPSFHVREMWRSGLLSGLLYSVGNLMGIVSIQRLGNFMGYSLNQSSIIVSGLWGIFYYKEISGVLHMLGFLLSACVVFVGILLLSREHV